MAVMRDDLRGCRYKWYKRCGL